MSTERKVISKSSKRKMCSSVSFPIINEEGKEVMKTVNRTKANDFTQMVVYKEKLPNGKYTSKTRHEKV